MMQVQSSYFNVKTEAHDLTAKTLFQDKIAKISLATIQT